MSGNFASPTLSSLNKIKPIAVIKAYDDVMGSKELLERSRALKASLSKSPSIERHREELEEIINMKSISIIKADLSAMNKAASSWVSELSARAGDANYRMELAQQSVGRNSALIKLKAVETFTSGGIERSRLISECEKKFASWLQVVSNCSEVIANMTLEPPSELTVQVNKANDALDSHMKSSLIWLTKIVQANTKTMCYYIHLLDLSVISNVCQCNRELQTLASAHSMVDFIDQIDEITLLAEIKGKLAGSEIYTYLCNCLTDLPSANVSGGEEDDENYPSLNDSLIETTTSTRATSQHPLSVEKTSVADVETFTLFLESLIASNERILLKLIYCRDFVTLSYKQSTNRGGGGIRLPGPSRKGLRRTWKSLCNGRSDCDNVIVFNQSEHLFWSTFWFNLKELLMSERLLNELSWNSEQMSWLNCFKVLVEDKVFSSPVAIECVESIYKHLHGLFTSQLWSQSHREMIQQMTLFDGSKPDVCLSEDKQMTKVGSNCYSALGQIKLHVTNCESTKDKDQRPRELSEDSKLLVTITVNSYLNWLQCEDIIGNWHTITALTLTLGDLVRLTQLLTDVSHFDQMVKFINELNAIKDHTWKQIVASALIEGTFSTKVTNVIPVQEYKSKSIKIRQRDWTLNALDNIQFILRHLTHLSANIECKSEIINSLSKSILFAVKDTKKGYTKLSKAGNKAFCEDVTTLLNLACQVMNIQVNQLTKSTLQANYINDLANLLSTLGQSTYKMTLVITGNSSSNKNKVVPFKESTGASASSTLTTSSSSSPLKVTDEKKITSPPSSSTTATATSTSTLTTTVNSASSNKAQGCFLCM